VSSADRSACAHNRSESRKVNKCGNNTLLCDARFNSLMSVAYSCYDVLNRNAPKSSVLPVQILRRL